MTEARASVQRPRRRDPPRSRATEHKDNVRAPIPLEDEDTHTDLQEDTKPEVNVPTDGQEMEHPVHLRQTPDATAVASPDERAAPRGPRPRERALLRPLQTCAAAPQLGAPPHREPSSRDVGSGKQVPIMALSQNGVWPTTNSIM